MSGKDWARSGQLYPRAWQSRPQSSSTTGSGLFGITPLPLVQDGKFPDEGVLRRVQGTWPPEKDRILSP